MQFHNPFPIGSDTATDVLEGEATVPFGARLVTYVPFDPDAVAEASRSYLDPGRQISVVAVDGATVPMMRRSSGETSTTTSSQDRQAPDDDTDVGDNG
ncbi:putative ATP-grasp-modified RiPP [Spiractinospora alimapuensis]|uniref:putative ATP-grasp-modified RiPP n=1 Tax=Spiractinospora alimapuensis TaxID=2820884 RepID=UPI001F17B5CB|nr:putative ATP-grasp-modified RiPP [Spiractinospora alimapuensis]